jgi:transcriptional regulator GlxA family with amidase domain
MHYGIVIYPGFQALDLFGPLDFLNSLSCEVPMKLSVLAASLDPVSTQVSSSEWNKAQSIFGQRLVPTHTFANPPPDLDIVLVPGGVGAVLEPLTEAVTFLRTTYPRLKYILSVCNGADLLSRASILDGKRATTNKLLFSQIAGVHPNVKWQPKARWVNDGNVWTASGIAAGLDLICAFIGHLHGEEMADKLARMLEYEPSKNPEEDPFAAVWSVPESVNV